MAAGKFLHNLNFLLLFLLPAYLTAGKYYDFTPRAREAYRFVLDLRLAEAGQQLDQLEAQEPDNLIALLLENYLETLRIIVDDDENAYRYYSKGMDNRLWLLSKGDARSPYYRYTQAEVRLQWSVLEMRFGDYLAAASDVKQAFQLLEENKRRFPDFAANNKSLGILHAVVGNVPDEYRWALKWLGGMSGTIQQGVQELESALAYANTHPDYVFEQETRALYALLQLHLNNREDLAWQALQPESFDPKSSPLAAFLLAQTAMRSGRNDRAIEILEMAPAGGVYYPFYYLDYLRGIARQNRLDPGAFEFFERFLANFKGKNAVKTTIQRLAWCDLLGGNTAGYQERMRQLKQSGTAQSDPDKAAQREAESGEMPNTTLLKARLLFDGGYYRKAYDLLQSAGAGEQHSEKEQTEWQYRLGRITQLLGRLQEAVSCYQATIDKGEKQPWYFACNAALQLGLMFEKQQNRDKAKLYFKKCLALHPEEYAASLHAKAKAGLNRLE